MGACMILSYVYFPVEHDLEKEEEALVLFSNSMNPEMAELVYEEVTNELFEDTDIFEVKKLFLEIIEEGFKALPSRMSTSFRFKDSVLYMSGGPSWGDSPTDQCEAIGRLGVILEFMREHGHNLKEDPGR